MNLEQFMLRVRECGDCWEWISGAKAAHQKRHPQVCIEGKAQLARRVAYELVKGPIPDGKRPCPTCGNERCINPEHQALLSIAQIGRRAAKRGAFSSPARGMKIAQARRKGADVKLTEEQARQIGGSEETIAVLAQRYGISQSHASQIKRGKVWKNYSNPFAGLGGRA